MFNMSLGHQIRRLIPDCTVLSDASMASPTFLSAALGEVELNYLRLQGRTLYLAHRHEVLPHQVVCGVAITSTADEPLYTQVDDGPELLPADQGRADLVLAVPDGTGPAAVAWSPADATRAEAARRRQRRSTWRLPALRVVFAALLDRKLWLGAAALVAVLVAGTVAMGLTQGINPWLAAYVTLLTAVGGADANTDGSTMQQVIQVVVTLAGIALIPVVTAAVVEALLNARLALALGRLRQPVEDHVVVVGLGNVGSRVIRGLHEFGVPVVAIDRVSTARGADLARRLDIPLVIGDASQEETLRAASVQTCRALVVVSTDDNVNLEAALNGRLLKPDLRVVLRLFNGDFAQRVQRAFGMAISHSVSYVAAPAFAAALMDQNVFGTLPIGRRVLLVAEVRVSPGSELDGMTVAEANMPGGARTIALHPHLEPRPRWALHGTERLNAWDRIIVVATRAGLARMLERGATPPVPEPGAPPAPQ
jgi:Trk K+ transport system NAD-binding subunit